MTKANHLAFPAEDRSNGDMPDGNYSYSGLTKREYFAALILSGVCANSDISDAFAKMKVETEKLIPMYAAAAVRQADALIEALNKPNQ